MAFFKIYNMFLRLRSSIFYKHTDGKFNTRSVAIIKDFFLCTFYGMWGVLRYSSLVTIRSVIIFTCWDRVLNDFKRKEHFIGSQNIT